VPFTAGPEAARKGYKADSIYTWTDPSGVHHRALGSQILQQVNDVERSLCERGHSFRERNTFEKLKVNSSTGCIDEWYSRFTGRVCFCKKAELLCRSPENLADLITGLYLAAIYILTWVHYKKVRSFPDDRRCAKIESVTK